MATTLCYATIFTPTEVVERGAVVTSDDGRIAYVGPMEDAPRVDGLRLEFRGRIVIPGLIDIHVHGGHGVGFYHTPDKVEQIAEDLSTYSQWVVGNGVTGFLCSVAGPVAEELVNVVSAYAGALEQDAPGAEPLGLHVEGPFLNVEKKGMWDPSWLRKPSLGETEAVLKAGRGWIRQMTLAPELPGAREVAAILRQAGVVASMGHTNADFDTASAALQGSFTHVTHTYNGQRSLHQREPGAVGAILSSDRVTAEVIADLVHVHAGAIKILIRCLGTDRVVLVSDAAASLGFPDGEYLVEGRRLLVKDGKSILPDGTIASSTATLNECVRNVNQKVGVPLPEAVKMASLNPSRAMGFANRLGSVAVGKDASLAVIDEQVNVYLTMVKGNIVYHHC